jgi:hypothetical protein
MTSGLGLLVFNRLDSPELARLPGLDLRLRDEEFELAYGTASGGVGEEYRA